MNTMDIFKNYDSPEQYAEAFQQMIDARERWREQIPPFGRICRSASRRVTLGSSKNPTAASMRILYPTRTVTTCFGHSVGQSH